MMINAEFLLQFQRCQRRSYLDIHGDYSQRDVTNELLLKLQQDRQAHRAYVMAGLDYQQPNYPPGDWISGAIATQKLMHQGVDLIHQAVVLAQYGEKYTLLSRPDLLVKQEGISNLGNWYYLPADIQLGKRPKQEYKVVAAFHAYLLAMMQEITLDVAWLILRQKDIAHEVDLVKWLPEIPQILEQYIQVIESQTAPDVFISRQKCNLCPWYNPCYGVAKSQQHLSLLPGVTPLRYSQLQTIPITTPAELAAAIPETLANLVGFDGNVATKLVIQAKSALLNKPLILPKLQKQKNLSLTDPVELYFDIEAQPESNFNYLLGVMVVDKAANTEKFYAFLAETPEEEQQIWQQFLDLAAQYPEAPIYHFCVYEVDTVKYLGKLYHTPSVILNLLLSRFVDVYEQLIQSVAIPVESYALKSIARWLGFEWREKGASGAKCIYWYEQWLLTGDRQLLETIQTYNEDDCRATHHVKDWLAKFVSHKLTYG
jgi:uncharacterized protein